MQVDRDGERLIVRTRPLSGLIAVAAVLGLLPLTMLVGGFTPRLGVLMLADLGIALVIAEVASRHVVATFDRATNRATLVTRSLFTRGRVEEALDAIAEVVVRVETRTRSRSHLVELVTSSGRRLPLGGPVRLNAGAEEAASALRAFLGLARAA